MSESNQRSAGSLSVVEREAMKEMFERLSGSYYEVLGVARECDRAALRGAYFDQLERFGADRFEGRGVGRYASQIEAITRELGAAFTVLSDPDRRARYDRRLALSADLIAAVEAETPRDTRTPAPRANPKTQAGYLREPTPTPTPSPTPSSRVSPAPKPTPAPARDATSAPPSISRDARTPMPLVPRQAQTPPTAVASPAPRSVTPPKEASGSRAVSSSRESPAPASVAPSRRPSQPPPPRSPAPLSAENSPGLPSGMALASLNRLRPDSRARDVQRNLEEIEGLIEKAARADDHGEMVRLLRHAITLKPDEASWRTRLARAEETFQDAEVVRLAVAARAAEKTHRWDQAGDLWSKASDMRPSDAQAALSAAQTLCEAGQDFPRAAEYAKRAARLTPDAVAAHVCLTRVYFKAGRTASARAALEQAAKLDPRNPDVVALGHKLRG